MPCQPHAARAVFRLVSIGLLFGIAALPVKAQSPALQDIARAQAWNQAVVDVRDAELQLQRWNLQQLTCLREDGFASWLDVARQQLLVDVLDRQQQASHDFGRFLHGLLLRAKNASNAEENDQRRPNSFPPIAVSLPGSVRLVGWLEPPHVSSNLMQCLATQRPAVVKRSDAQEKELTQAKETLSRAEDRYRVYAQLAGVSEEVSQRKRAELQLILARAELRLLNLKQAHLRSEKGKRADLEELLSTFKTATHQIDAECFTDGELTHCVTPDSHRGLGDATLRVAAAEADATGELRVAQIALQRHSLRLTSYQQLYSEGHASRLELDAVQNQVNEADRVVRQLRNRQASLKQSYEELRSRRKVLRPESDSANERVTSNLAAIGTTDVRSWPLLWLADPFVVRHLVDLRRQYYETLAHRDGLSLKLALLNKHYARLEAIEKVQPVATDNLKSEPTGVTELEATLIAGRECQLRFLGVDIRHHQARAKAAEEMLKILALEEARLLQQFTRQQLLCESTNGAANDCDGSTVQTVAFKPSRGRFSYLESHDPESFGRVCELAFSKADLEIVRFAYQPRGVPASPPLQFAIDRSCNRFRPLDSYGTANSIYGQVNACLRYGHDYTARCNTRRFRTLRCGIFDPFGIRCVDDRIHCRPSSRQIPSYLRGLRPE